MQGDPQVIAALQAQLKNELTAINQYYMHYRMFKHWGFEALGQGGIQRIDRRDEACRFAHGPHLAARWPAQFWQDLGKLQIGEDVPEALACDLRLEQAAQQCIKDGIRVAEAAHDFVSRELLLKILDDTEEHIDFLETQLALIESIGLQNYLQSKMGES